MKQEVKDFLSKAEIKLVEPYLMKDNVGNEYLCIAEDISTDRTYGESKLCINEHNIASLIVKHKQVLNMRTINELLIILRDNARVKKSCLGLRQKIESGLCYEIGKLEELGILSTDEWSILRQHIHTNAPDYIKDSGYRWAPYLWKPRLKWLNKQIKLTK